MECSSRMLQHTDAAVKILQDMVLIFGKYYESRKQAVPGLDAPDFEALELNYRTVTDLLASIWPCESQFVAVLGPTGCGKSTLLNNLLKLTCVTGERYDSSVDKDSCRAVLRETAKAYSKVQQTRKKESSCPSDEPAGEVLRGSDPANHRYQPIGEMQMKMERVALAGSLGLCCAQDREAYLSTHLPQCDQHPFLLLSGRMGDGGTTKVTAIEWGASDGSAVGNSANNAGN